MVDSFNSKRVLEVGCGPGLHSELIAKSFINDGALLVSCDFSHEMVKMMKERYADSGFTKEEGVSVSFYEVDHTKSTDSRCEGLDQPIERKRVVGCIADNMRLPFDDSSFNAYVSNLSCMIVPNPMK